MSVKSRKRTRMLPAVRQSLILDCAANIVAKEGVAAVSMERVAQDAGVSRALVYLYYDNITDLLQQLLLRETLELRAKQRAVSAVSDGFEDYIYKITSLSLQNVSEMGDFTAKLMHEPTIAVILSSYLPAFRKDSGEFIAKRIVEVHKIPLPLAARLADVCMGITARAGDHMQKYRVPLPEITDLAVTMILGAMRAVADKHHAGIAEVNPSTAVEP